MSDLGSTKNELKFGSFLSVAGVLLNIALGFFMSPVSIHFLGESTYGLYQLMWSLVGYTVVLDMGFGTTVVRYVAKYRAEQDKEKESKFIFLSMMIYIAISAAVLMVGVLLYFNIQNFFGKSLTPEEISLGKTLFQIMLVNFLLNMLFSIFPGIVSGYEKFVFQKGLIIVKQLARTAVVIAAFFLGGKSIALAVIDLIVTAVFLLIQALYVFFRLEIRIRPQKIESGYVKGVFSFSIFIFIMLIVDQLNWKVDQFFIGGMIDAASVGVYSIAMQFPLYFSSISFAITYNFLPRAMQLVSDGKSAEDYTVYMVKLARILFMVLGIVLTGFLLFGQEFIRLWVGDSYAPAYWIGGAIMLSLFLPLLQEGGTNILQAKKMHKFRSVVYLIIAVLNVILTVILIPHYGLLGACAGTVLSYLLGNVLIMNWYYAKKVKINLKHFYFGTLKGNLPAIAIAAAAGFLLNLIPGSGWLMLCVRIGIFCLIYAAAFITIGMNPQEKQDYLMPVWNRIRRLWGKGE